MLTTYEERKEFLSKVGEVEGAFNKCIQELIDFGMGTGIEEAVEEVIEEPLDLPEGLIMAPGVELFDDSKELKKGRVLKHGVMETFMSKEERAEQVKELLYKEPSKWWTFEMLSEELTLSKSYLSHIIGKHMIQNVDYFQRIDRNSFGTSEFKAYEGTEVEEIPFDEAIVELFKRNPNVLWTVKAVAEEAEINHCTVSRIINEILIEGTDFEIYLDQTSSTGARLYKGISI